MIGKMPTEMFVHFFKSFTDKAQCNLNIKAEGANEHHKIEAIFKAFAKAVKMAVRRDLSDGELAKTQREVYENAVVKYNAGALQISTFPALYFTTAIFINFPLCLASSRRSNRAAQPSSRLWQTL